MTAYVHGYETRENERLHDQAGTLAELLHWDTGYIDGSCVLEAACGVGAQTVRLARNSSGARFVAVDISEDSLAQARDRVRGADLDNVTFEQGDLFNLRFDNESFDHVFVCFVLEHLEKPLNALRVLKRLLKPGGTITVIEGDHGSAQFHPDSEAARDAIRALVEVQRRSGGDAMIGRRLFPLLSAAGFQEVHVSPRFVYVDSSKPELVDGFTKKTFTAMVEGIRERAIQADVITAARFDEGVRALYRTADEDGVFCYTFFKAVATK
jgi:SAM-dependent methyltransferase